ncbi:MAG: alpha/beta fold hydrolase [Kiritimatiellae bacterium]|nr:alpha/beta fold hydrolase [Kiritimatiellia bacterium]
MNAKRMFLFVGVAIVTATATVASVDKTAAEMMASARLADAGVTAQVGAGYAGAKRYTFKFEGYKAYFDEPVAAKPGRQWMWCMKWPGAYAEFTGQEDGVRRGYYYVYLDDIDWMSPKGVEIAKRFHDFLVGKLGFAAKANLIGMSWGGFYSTRYAAAHPEDVARIYLDAPLMNFDGFRLHEWPAARKAWGESEGGEWTKDPRMPINLADKIAKAKIPVLLLYGGADTVVPPSKNCEIFIPRFKAAGGNIKVFKRDMYGHHPHGFQGAANIGAIVDFFEGKPVSVK